MIKVILSRDDIVLAREFGMKRFESNRANQVKENKRGQNHDPLAISVDGMAGEIAFGRRFGLEPDWTIEPRSGGPDFTTARGTRIDVKATRLPRGRLICPADRVNPSVDVYLLALLYDFVPTVYLFGHASKAVLCDPANVMQLQCPTFALDQESPKLRKLLANSTIAEIDAWLAPPPAADHSGWIAAYSRVEAEQWGTSS